LENSPDDNRDRSEKAKSVLGRKATHSFSYGNENRKKIINRFNGLGKKTIISHSLKKIWIPNCKPMNRFENFAAV